MVGGAKSGGAGLASWWVEVRIGFTEEVTFQQTSKEVGHYPRGQLMEEEIGSAKVASGMTGGPYRLVKIC